MENKKIDTIKQEEKILFQLRKNAEQEEIPASLYPEWMRRRLEEKFPDTDEISEKNVVLGKQKSIQKKHRLTYSKVLAAAAGICVLIGCTAMAAKIGLSHFEDNMNDAIAENTLGIEDATEQEGTPISELYAEAGTEKGFVTVTYEEVYASMSKVWDETIRYRSGMYGEIQESEAADDSAMDGAPVSGSAQKEANLFSDKTLFGTTNIQTVGVDEGDVVKNDGRYLYQIVYKDSDEQSIQIIDTKDGLKEVANVGAFRSIEEFYVWNDLLLVIENKYLEQTYLSDMASKKMWSDDLMFQDNTYHQISIYNIADRNMPKEQKVFTLQGSYRSSRIADGYFYGFSRYYASPGTGEKDYDAYIPRIEGEHLEEDHIVLPKESEGSSYLVMVSIDLHSPSQFADTIGIVSDSDRYYVSNDHIYVTYGDSEQPKEEGWHAEQTAILQFSYEKGIMTLEAEGSIPGYLNDSFSMDEYEQHLRVVTTVNENYWKPITDDRTGEYLGMGSEESRQTNALYVLDDSLAIVGKIENLAEDERIYSARFFGETGYFVTFRETDPLFAVDLTDPKHPIILSELKVSGFSEYLHFYGENRLFGFGMEADEETGITEGLKMSMFDISDPANVQEISRHSMEEYYYSEALYNHHAILIHPDANIIGFAAEGNQSGNGNGYVQEYLIFAYEQDAFVEKLKIDTALENEEFYYNPNLRGTFIGDTFYLLRGNGRVESYDLNTGVQLEVLETKAE